MKKPILLFTSVLILLLIGRNLSFLPRFDFRSEMQKTNTLRDKVNKILENKKGIFSVYYKDLITGEEFGISDNTVLTGASLNKLAIVAYLYHLAADKQINLEETIVVQEEDIQDYGTGVIRYEEPGKAYTLKLLAKLTLEKSDNTAAHLIALKLGMENVQKYVQELGLLSTSMEDNKTTARDMEIFLS